LIGVCDRRLQQSIHPFQRPGTCRHTGTEKTPPRAALGGGGMFDGRNHKGPHRLLNIGFTLKGGQRRTPVIFCVMLDCAAIQRQLVTKLGI
jgi:hypothetical protein